MNLDKRKILLKKKKKLIEEIDKAILIVGDDKKEYLYRFKSVVNQLIKKTKDGTLPPSNGGLIGTMRAISEYDRLTSISELYDAAVDVDLFYSKECCKWK